MRLLSAELHNICQHEYLRVEFSPGLTGIVGKNGSGKSNLVKAVYAAITGDFSRNDGLKIDNISQFAKKSAKSKIVVALEHAGAKLNITKSLRPASNRLVVAAPDAPTTTITKSNEAIEAVSSILGVSNKILSDYVFVDQWAIFDFLAMIPSDRAKAFQRLFKTERAEFLYALLGKHVDRIVIPTPGVNRDVVTKRLEANKTKYQEIRSSLRKVELRLISEAVEEVYRTFDNWKHKQALEKEVRAIREKTEGLVVELTDMEQKLSMLRVEDTELKTYIDDSFELLVEARNDIRTLAHYELVEKKRREWTEKLDIATNAPLPLEPEEPVGYIGADDTSYKEWWESLKHELYRLDRLFAVIKDDIRVCPTCGSSLEERIKTRDEDRRKYDEMIVVRDEFEQQLLKSDQYRRALSTYAAILSARQRDIHDIELQLSNLIQVEKPTKTREELDAFVETYTTASKKYEKVHKALSDLTINFECKRGIYDQLDDDLKHKGVQLAKLTVTEDDVAVARARLTEHENAKTDKAQLQASSQIILRTIQDDEDTLKELAEVELEAEAERSWITYCGDMRFLVQREKLPRLIAHNYLELMQDEINSLLIRFDSPFTVTTDESLSFIAHFRDGRRVPAGRLSGGEKVLLALAFRVIVNDIFAKDLGLLILDEPTAGLDEGNLVCLRTAVERLKELSSTRGLQVVIITHENSLLNLFDQVISLDKAEAA